jgi:antitoxin component YwqK of YwqJK toxin-antitoxin module
MTVLTNNQHQMNRLPILLIVLFSLTQSAQSQFLTLPELVVLCNSSEIDSAYKMLNDRNWSFVETDTDEESGLKYETWSYGISNSEYYDEYSSMAPGYLNMISRAGVISGVHYTVFEYELYNSVFNSMKSVGFKKFKSKDLKSGGITAYSDGNLILLYNIEQISGDDEQEESYSAFTIYLVKKPSDAITGESGPRKEYYDGGELRAEYILKNGKPEGVVKIYDKSGSIIQESNYRNGELHGERRFYYPSVDQNTGLPIPYAGRLYLVTNYSEGMQHGKETWYYQASYESFPCEKADSAGIMVADTCRRLIITEGKEIIHFRKGVLNGMYELYDSEGALTIKGKYRNGVETGKWFRRPDEI